MLLLSRRELRMRLSVCGVITRLCYLPLSGLPRRYPKSGHKNWIWWAISETHSSPAVGPTRHSWTAPAPEPVPRSSWLGGGRLQEWVFNVSINFNLFLFPFFVSNFFNKMLFIFFQHYIFGLCIYLYFICAFHYIFWMSTSSVVFFMHCCLYWVSDWLHTYIMPITTLYANHYTNCN